MNKKYAVLFCLMVLLVLSSCSGNSSSRDSISYQDDESKISEYSTKDKDIYNIPVDKRAEVIEYIYSRYDYYDSQAGGNTGDKYSDAIWVEASEKFVLSKDIISLIWVDQEAIAYYNAAEKAKNSAKSVYAIAKENNYTALYKKTDFDFDLACEASKDILKNKLGTIISFFNSEECWAVFKIDDLYNVYSSVCSKQNGWQRFSAIFEMSPNGEIDISYGVTLFNETDISNPSSNIEENDFKNVTDENEFWTACAASEKIVKQKLSVPSSAKFSSVKSDWEVRQKENTYVVQSYVEAKNALGVFVKEKFIAKFTMSSNGKISDYSVSFSE